jgi:hypothetical protein
MCTRPTAFSRVRVAVRARLADTLRRLHRLSFCAQCKICLQPFICTSTESKLKEHSDNKHPKAAFAECFPDYQPKK